MGGSGSGRKPMPTIWRIPDELWFIVRTVLPAEELRRSRGRPWIESRRVLDGVLYVLRTGCQWKAVPAEYGSGSTVHRRFQRWVERGCWEAMWRLLLQYYDAAESLEWTWQSAMSAVWWKSERKASSSGAVGLQLRPLGSGCRRMTPWGAIAGSGTREKGARSVRTQSSA